jgi:flavorubredoxin
MKCETISRNGEHRWLCFGQDPNKPSKVIDTNQYVVCDGDATMLLDPGGMEIFPHFLGPLSERIAMDTVRHILISHQDPDVASSLPLWRAVADRHLKVHLSWMWTGFVCHFDAEADFVAIPDEGAEVTLGPRARLRFLPAHYLHSPGNFSVYDPAARILFSGDIGAALVPEKERRGLFVEDFLAHVRFMEAFHKRWMGSSAARDAWIEMVARLDVAMLAPQHGLIFRGDDVKRFLDWFARLEIGNGVGAILAGAISLKPAA